MSPEGPESTPGAAPVTRDQVDACCRLHRRIRVRTDVIRRTRTGRGPALTQASHVLIVKAASWPTMKSGCPDAGKTGEQMRAGS